MRYFVSIGGRSFEVELAGGELRIDGRTVQAELVAVPGTPVRHLLLDGRSFPLLARAGSARGEWRIELAGERFAADVVDERTRAIRALQGRAGEAQGPKPVKAPMPGLVTRVQVAAGERVEPGQGVAIIEAMKMENELKAEVGGVVARVLVSAGQPVEKGAVLVEFEAG